MEFQKQSDHRLTRGPPSHLRGDIRHLPQVLVVDGLLGRDLLEPAELADPHDLARWRLDPKTFELTDPAAVGLRESA